MTPVRSLRARVITGAALWTGGLFLGALVALSAVMFSMPQVHLAAYHWFLHAHAGVLAIAIMCMVAGLWQVKRGFLALDDLRSRLAHVREGRTAHIDGDHPPEVQPLVTDLNALLDHRERAVRRAVAKAGDLAHGLKTPLAVLSHEADRAGAAGQHELAAAVGEQVLRMQRQIDYHLAQARAAASGATPGARSAVLESADGLARTLMRLHDGRGLRIDVRVPADHVVRAQREDLDEMLGNLLDNACKWARARVAIASSRDGAGIAIVIDDDGPGLEASKREIVLRRGVRADEAAPGSGLGLAIVQDLAELYGGSISLEGSPLGGLRAQLRLPNA
jgi:signal transduction histidine kinase